MIINNILIIDDNPIILGALTTVIGTQLKDCSILAARNGLEGIATIESMPIAFVLTDLEMPVMDGYGVISPVVRHERFSLPGSKGETC